MLLLIIIALLLLIVVGVFSGNAAAARRHHLATDPAGYHRNIGISRIIWGVLMLAAGVAFWPLWIIALFLLIYGFHCLGESKRLNKPPPALPRPLPRTAELPPPAPTFEPEPLRSPLPADYRWKNLA